MIFFTDKTMTVINNGKTEFIDLETELGKECLSLYQKSKHNEILDIIEQSKLIGGGVEEGENGTIVVDGVPMSIELAHKVREFKKKGLPFDYLIKLAERIDKIESFHVRNQLYGFLKHNGHPITKDGTFIAYKMVSKDFKDLRTHTFDNSVGSVVEMERRQVNDDPTETCSAGLHVASYDYAHTFGKGHLVICEVAPEDVVAVPIDYNQMKMRTCRYKVVGIAKEMIEEPTYEEEGDFWGLVEEDDYITLIDSREDYQILREVGEGVFNAMVTNGEREGHVYVLDLKENRFEFI